MSKTYSFIFLLNCWLICHTGYASVYIVEITNFDVEHNATNPHSGTNNILLKVETCNNPVVDLENNTLTAAAGSNSSIFVNASGTALSYQWQVSTDNGTSFLDLSNGGNYQDVNSATLLLSSIPEAFADHQYRCVVSEESCSSISGVTTLNLSSSPLCASSPIEFCCEYVSTVSINGVSFDGNDDYNGPGYYDYTTTPIPDVIAGSTVPVSITVITNSEYQEYVKIWIDFNKNGIPGDVASELVFDQNETFNGTHTFTGNISIPADAYNGNLYARLIMQFDGSPAVCGEYDYGNTFDFKIPVVSGIEPITLNLSLNKAESADGGVISSPEGIDSETNTFENIFSEDEEVTLTATPAAGSRFDGWFGDVSSTSNPLVLTMEESKNIVAKFALISKPVVSTSDASTITDVTAILGGTVTNDGGATVTERGIVYNTSGAPNVDDNTKIQIGTDKGSFSDEVSGLDPETEYFVRAYATNSEGTSYGGEKSFTTLASNTAPTDISLSSASVNQSGGSHAVIGSLSTTDADGSDTHTYSLVAGTGDDDNGIFNINGSDLRANDASAMAPGDYSVRIQTNDGTAIYQEAFTISVVDDIAPSFENGRPATASIAGTSFNLNIDMDEAGTVYYVVVADGSTAPTSAEVKAGTASGGGAVAASGNQVLNSGDFTHSFNVTGLTSETAYDVYVVAEDNEATPNLQTNPTKLDFTTLEQGEGLAFDGTDDKVTTNISLTSADYPNLTTETWFKPERLNHTDYQGIIGDDVGGYNSRQIWVNTDNKIVLSASSSEWTLDFTVETGKWYHIAVIYSPDEIKAYINGVEFVNENGSTNTSTGTMAIGVGWEQQQHFQGGIDEVRIWDVARTPSEIESLKGTELDGDEAHLIHYFDFNQGTKNGNNTGLTTLEDRVSGGEDGTLENFTLNGSTSNWLGGNEPAAPTVFSSAASDVEGTEATLNGEVTNDGGSAITERGFVYSLTDDDDTPSIAEIDGTSVVKKTVSGTTGAFSTSLSGLNGLSSYSFVAYAINAEGTEEGEVETFTTLDPNTLPVASNVTFSGILEVGEQLTGDYDYADDENDAEDGTTFQWYRSDDVSGTNKTVITDADAIIYTLTLDDEDKYISFEVAPHDGTSAGIAAESSRQGAVTNPMPDIQVKGNDAGIANGSNTPSANEHTDFGSVAAADGTISRTFTLENSGTAGLSLVDNGGEGYITFAGTHADDFTVSDVPSSTIAPGNATNFTITFDPAAVGERSAMVSIYSDDPDENPYTFAIKGSGTNTAPVASNIAISGTLKIGDVLTGTYDFSDADAHEEDGSTFRWYRSEDAQGTDKTAIAGANAKTYTLLAADQDKYLSFEVIPNDGMDAGTAVESALLLIQINDVPSFTAGSDQAVSEDAGIQTIVGWATAISAGPADESGQALTFNLSNDNETLFAVQPAITADGTLTFTPATDANGTAIVTVSLSDDGGTDNGGDDTSEAATFTITVNPVNDAPVFTAGSDQTITAGAESYTISAWANGIAAGPANESNQQFTFHVSNDQNDFFTTQPAISSQGDLSFAIADGVSGEATVTVRLSDDGGTVGGGVDTSEEVTFTISIGKLSQEISFDPIEDKKIGQDPIVLDATGGDSGRPVTYQLVTEPASGVVYLEGNLLIIEGVGTVTVIASQAGNSLYKAAQDVSVSFSVLQNELFLPTLFSPNEDGNNDYFILRGAGGVATIEMTIYNREGEQVYQSSDFDSIIHKGWDGTYQGKKLIPGNYVWVLKGSYTNGETLQVNGKNTGMIRLIR